MADMIKRDTKGRFLPKYSSREFAIIGGAIESLKEMRKVDQRTQLRIKNYINSWLESPPFRRRKR